MTRRLTALCFALLAPPAFAQTGAGVPTRGPFLPNFYNRQTQPLSPYLNLLRGANLGVNYFYGVRPGLPSGGQTFAGASGGGGAYASPYSSFSSGPANAGQLEPGEGYVLPPAGHLNAYGNYFGTAGSSLPGYGNSRGGVAPGIANTRPTAGSAKPNPRK